MSEEFGEGIFLRPGQGDRMANLHIGTISSVGLGTFCRGLEERKG